MDRLDSPVKNLLRIENQRVATGPDVGVRFSAEELAIIDAIAEAREWSRAQVVRHGFKRALAAGLVVPPPDTSPGAAPPPRRTAAPAGAKK